MSDKFRVYEHEIPSKITINMGGTEKALFSRMLTSFGFGVNVAGDTFEHIFKKGLQMYYKEHFPEEYEK